MKLSVCILNWMRPKNVRRILAHLRQTDFHGVEIDDITIWNNNPAERFDANDACRIVNASCDLGLYTRFAAAALANQPVVLIQDDDLLLPAETLSSLAGKYAADPAVVHGIFGRKPRPDGTYAADVNRQEAQVPIVLTRVAIVSRSTCIAALRLIDELRPMLDAGRPQGNGEDICLSYAAMIESDRLNRAHKLAVHELPAPHAIHGRAGHIEHRTRVMQACEEVLKKHRRAPARGKEAVKS